MHLHTCICALLLIVCRHSAVPRNLHMWTQYHHSIYNIASLYVVLCLCMWYYVVSVPHTETQYIWLQRRNQIYIWHIWFHSTAECVRQRPSQRPIVLCICLCVYMSMTHTLYVYVYICVYVYVWIYLWHTLMSVTKSLWSSDMPQS